MRGFSLIEVIVALTVASILLLAYLGGQRSGLSMVEATATTWEQINYAESFLLTRSFETQTTAGDSWLPWPDIEGAEWRLEREEPQIVFVREIDFTRGFDEDGTSQETDDQQPEDAGETASPIELPDTYILRTRLNGAVLDWPWLAKP